MQGRNNGGRNSTAMKLLLTPAQAAQIEPHLRYDAVLLARVDRLAFDGSNGGTSGALTLVFTSIPIDRLASVRAAIAGHPAPAPTKKAKSK
jgi:hypothetical protein